MKDNDTKKVKKVPEFWWDFGKNDEIIVESTSDKYPVCGRFPFTNPEKEGCAASAIEQAEKLIEDFKAGRKTPVAC